MPFEDQEALLWSVVYHRGIDLNLAISKKRFHRSRFKSSFFAIKDDWLEIDSPQAFPAVSPSAGYGTRSLGLEGRAEGRFDRWVPELIAGSQKTLGHDTGAA